MPLDKTNEMFPISCLISTRRQLCISNLLATKAVNTNQFIVWSLLMASILGSEYRTSYFEQQFHNYLLQRSTKTTF